MRLWGPVSYQLKASFPMVGGAEQDEKSDIRDQVQVLYDEVKGSRK